MSHIKMTCAIAFFVAACSANAQSNQVGITNGHDAPYEAYPFFAAIFPTNTIFGPHSGTGLCGGALIAPDWVITAKHCMRDYVADSINPEVAVDAGDTNRLESVQFAQAKGIFFQGDLSTSFPDIALIHLDRKLSKKPIEIAPYDAAVGENATVIGYGYVGNFAKNPLPTVLQQVTIPIVSPNYCTKQKMTPDSLCVGFPGAPRKNAAPGDSGGPLFQEKNGEFFLVGIVNRGKPNTSSMVYLNPHKYIDWVNKTIKENP